MRGKNKLQQMLVTTLLFIFSCFLLYWALDSFFFLTLLMEGLAMLVGSYLIFFDQRNAPSKFAWLFAILMIPYLGLFLFFLIGRNQKNRRFHLVQIESRKKLHHFLTRLFKEHSYWLGKEDFLSRELYHLSGSAALRGNDLKALPDGEIAYQHILSDVRQAKYHIHLFYFIYKADETGNELVALLKDKVKEGVEVRFMYDSVGSIKLPFEWLSELEDAGIEVRPYDLVNSPLLSTRLNWRNHRKMVVVDGKIAHIGGMNLGNEYRSMTTKFHYWRDTNLRIVGPAALEVQGVFIYDWLFGETDPVTIDYFLKRSALFFPVKEIEQSQDENCQIIFGGPYDDERIVHDAFMDVIGKATTSIKIASPYFVPDDESLATLRRAARSGVKVQVLIPGKGDRALSYFGNTSFIDRLIEAEIEVYFYDKTSFLHGKYLIIDNQIVTIGSTNFDVRSFYLNHEISAFIYGPSETVNEVIAQFEIDLTHSRKITKEERMNRPISERVKERLSEFFTPLL